MPRRRSTQKQGDLDEASRLEKYRVEYRIASDRLIGLTYLIVASLERLEEQENLAAESEHYRKQADLLEITKRRMINAIDEALTILYDT